jgi:hypothetical protein
LAAFVKPFTQASSVPRIVIDGNLSDWAGVYPIINGTSGDKSNPFFYGIVECYVLVEQDQFYFVFQKKPGGSDSWQMFFDTDLSNETGYPINGMRAMYMLQMSFHQGFYVWGGNRWADSGLNLTIDYNALHGGAKTPDGSLVFAYGGIHGGSGLGQDWYEGKINLSLLGNPTVFGLVFELPWEGLVAPENRYVVVFQSQNVSLAASCTGACTLHYGQSFETVFNLLNFGPSNMSNADLKINLSKNLNVVSGQTTWRGTILEAGRLTLDFEAESLNYGQATSYSNITWVDPSSNENWTVNIPFSTNTVPSVSLDLKTPANMTAGEESSINITVINLDPLTAPLTIEAEQPSNAGFLLNNFSLMLPPNSTMQLLSVPVMPTTLGTQSLAITAQYNETNVSEASLTVTVNAPRIYMTSLNMPSKMEVGIVYSISAVIENEEKASYRVSFSVNPGPGLICMNGQSVNVTLLANSNTTVTLQLKGEKTGLSSATVNLNSAYGPIEYPSQFFVINIEQASISTPVLIAATAAVVLVVLVVLTLKRKAISEKLKKKA